MYRNNTVELLQKHVFHTATLINYANSIKENQEESMSFHKESDIFCGGDYSSFGP